MADDQRDRQDPTEQYPRPDFPAQDQPHPGWSGPMDPPPDHGEESYRGSGRLEGRRTVITGGDSGIGRAVALAFAREGADVLFTYLEQEEGEARETARLVEGGSSRLSHRPRRPVRKAGAEAGTGGSPASRNGKPGRRREPRERSGRDSADRHPTLSQMVTGQSMYHQKRRSAVQGHSWWFSGTRPLGGFRLAPLGHAEHSWGRAREDRAVEDR